MRTLFFLATFLAAVGTAQATTWETQTVKAAAKSSRCIDPPIAEREAHARVAKDGANICREQSYGWHLQEVKNEGDVDCTSCGDGKARCQVSTVELVCRRLKPGTVGMGPFMGGHDD